MLEKTKITNPHFEEPAQNETAVEYKRALRLGAYIFAIDKVAKALNIRGIYG